MLDHLCPSQRPAIPLDVLALAADPTAIQKVALGQERLSQSAFGAATLALGTTVHTLPFQCSARPLIASLGLSTPE